MTVQLLNVALGAVLLMAPVQTPSLNSSSPRERTEAVRAMAVLGNRDAVPALVEAYRNESRREIRAEIAAALGRIRDRSAIQGLSEAMWNDFQRDVRLQAIDSLLRLYIPIADDEGFFSFVGGITRVFTGSERPSAPANVIVDPEAREALLQVVREDPDWEVRREAVYALGSLRATDSLPALIDELEGPRHREDREVRVAMVDTLGGFRDQEAGPALTRLIRDEDDRVAEAAIRSVGLIGYREAFPVLSNLFRSSNDDDMREHALQSIALMRDPDSVALFESLLDSNEEKYRELAAEGLARLDYDASGFVARIATERDAGVRIAQAFALVASGDAAHLPLLIDTLDTRRYTQAEVYLYELGRFEGRIDLLYPHLRNPDADIRERLLRILGRVGNPESRPFIQPLTEDRNSNVASAAVAALRQMTGR
jgi:HEAT repeat protein